MHIASRTVITALVFLLVFGAGGICLQIFLSRRESRWPGLVLPLVTLLVGNIPTLVLLAVYWAAREKRRVKSQIDIMKIDEL